MQQNRVKRVMREGGLAIVSSDRSYAHRLSPRDNAKLILRVLDMGAQGIQVPHIEGLEGAKRAVAAVRYPPLGQRGAAEGPRVIV
jgi:2-keto-3-deoxy-L-rhamnonate aldolase RhmA